MVERKRAKRGRTTRGSKRERESDADAVQEVLCGFLVLELRYAVGT